MLFQLDKLSTPHDADAVDRAIKARDAYATTSIDIESGRVRIAGQLTEQQATDAFREAGFDAVVVAGLNPPGRHGGGCCGSCSGE
jgi:copper chaperone CopZ